MLSLISVLVLRCSVVLQTERYTFSVRLSGRTFFIEVNYMEFNRDVFMDLLMDLDRLKGQISKIQNKISKMYLSCSKPQPTTNAHKENDNGKKQ